MVEYDLALDESSKKDHKLTIEDLPFIYDKKAVDEIGSYVKIDYIASQGFKLINKNQTLAYGLSLKNI